MLWAVPAWCQSRYDFQPHALQISVRPGLTEVDGRAVAQQDSALTLCNPHGGD
jgi:hypothetical protein